MLLKPSTKPGQRALLLVVLDDEVLPRQGEHPLDDHVVERDRLDERLEVLGLAREPVDAALQHLVEQHVELRVQVLARLRQAVLEVVRLEHADLVVEAVEEAHVARLVGDLGAEEDAHLLGGRGAHHRAELLGHLLLADEERAEPVHALEALLLGDPLVPVDPVLGEVDVLGAPTAAAPRGGRARRSRGGSPRRGRRTPGGRGRVVAWKSSRSVRCMTGSVTASLLGRSLVAGAA